MQPTSPEHFDVLIIGAGLSGIDAAWHLTRYLPRKTFAILEGRERVGGTWDLFRYPGIRSDSDMLTMGYSFRPWTEPKTISDGAAIRSYIEDTARESGLAAGSASGTAWCAPPGRARKRAGRSTRSGATAPGARSRSASPPASCARAPNKRYRTS